jgi:GT2 family glycosyltransferase
LNPKVGITIPTHNRRDHLLACLESLARLDYTPFDVVVADDGSTDGSAAAVAGQFPAVKVLQGDGSLWWSGAINLAISEALKANPAYILLLNDDDIIPLDLLSVLVAYAEAHPKTIVGSRIYRLNPPDTLFSAGAAVDWRWRGIYDLDVSRVPPGPLEVPATSGQGVLVPRACFDAVGLMDAKTFPQYSGDVDFGFRAHRAGFQCVILPEARVWNDKETTGALSQNRRGLAGLWELFFGRRSYMNVGTQLRFYLRHCPAWFLPLALVGLTYRYAAIFGVYVKESLSKNARS